MAVRLWTTWHTCSVDGRDHAVTDEEMATRMAEDAGHYTAVCMHDVLVTPMICPPGPRCRRCVAFLRAQAATRTGEQRPAHQHRRPGVLRRILHRAGRSPVVPSQDVVQPAWCRGAR
ncbi:MAG: hypothetical protein ACRDQ5_25495 [Sciscionella sp.]